MSKVVGIDLGSTLSEIAIIENGKATVIANEDGSYTTPSVVSIIDGERKVGSSAKRQQIVRPKETIYLIKRFMGATYDESGDAIKHVQYDVTNEDGKPRVKIGDRLFSPEEISSYILSKLKKVAEDYCGEEIKDAVITVPAFFNDDAKKATKLAGELAGLNVLRIIAEPTAAILSSKIDMKKGGKYMVTDFGGSTLDNSVADIGDGVVEILSTNGDVYLGGSDIDKALADYIVSEYKKESGVDVSKDTQAMSRVIDEAEKAKIALTNSSSTDINLPYITAVDGVPQHLTMSITRAKFEQVVKPYIDRVVECAKKAIELADIKASDLDGILLIGGSCRIPYLQQRLTDEFGVELIKSSNMDLAVAEGAVIQANNIVGGEGSKDILLVDVNPISIGIETLGGVFTKMIDANTTIPCKKSETFTTAVDNQTAITVRVLQGERPMANDNKQLGIFNLEGILPSKRGVPQIEVTFDIDVSGILNVTAKDKGTNKEQSIRIEGSSKLSEDEIAKIKAEAEKFADADKKAKEEADAVNKADAMAFAQEKMLEEQKDNINDDEKSKLEGLIKDLKEAASNKNVSRIDELEQSINEVWQGVAQRVYSSQSQQQTTEQTSDDNTQEAEFTEVK